MERETIHISDDTQRIALVDTKTYDGGAIGSPSHEIRYQLGNHLQSASLELDNTAAIISYEEIACDSRSPLNNNKTPEQYHPFGTSAYRLVRTSPEVSQKRHRYCGKERDEESGLYYYGARYYAAWLCRFVSVDPLKDDYPMWSSYVYAGNMPVTLTDVNGEEQGIAILKILAKLTVGVEYGANVTAGVSASISKGISVDALGNVGIFFSKGGLLKDGEMEDGVSTSAGFGVGVKAEFLTGYNEVTDMVGEGGYGMMDVTALEVISMGVSTEHAANGDNIGFGLSLGAGFGISPLLNLTFEKTNVQMFAMSEDDWEVIYTAKSSHYKEMKDWWVRPNPVVVWQVEQTSYLNFDPIYNEDGTIEKYEAIIEIRVFSKCHRKGCETIDNPPSVTVEKRTGVYFNYDEATKSYLGEDYKKSTDVD